MCLFKRDSQEGNCTHDECKNYYLLNNQICMHSKQTLSDPRQLMMNFSNDDQMTLLEKLQKKIKKEGKEQFGS